MLKLPLTTVLKITAYIGILGQLAPVVLRIKVYVKAKIYIFCTFIFINFLMQTFHYTVTLILYCVAMKIWKTPSNLWQFSKIEEILIASLTTQMAQKVEFCTIRTHFKNCSTGNFSLGPVWCTYLSYFVNMSNGPVIFCIL